MERPEDLHDKMNVIIENGVLTFSIADGFTAGLVMGAAAFLLGYYGASLAICLWRRFKTRRHKPNDEIKYSYIIWLSGSEWSTIQSISRGKLDEKSLAVVKKVAEQCRE